MISILFLPQNQTSYLLQFPAINIVNYIIIDHNFCFMNMNLFFTAENFLAKIQSFLVVIFKINNLKDALHLCIVTIFIYIFSK